MNVFWDVFNAGTLLEKYGFYFDGISFYRACSRRLSECCKAIE